MNYVERALWLSTALVIGGCGPTAPPRSTEAPAPSASAASPAQRGAVRGRVVVRPSGAAVAGAVVALARPFTLASAESGTITARTDATGAFAFERVPEGRYGVTATAPHVAAGYGGVIEVADAPVDVSVEVGGTTTVTFEGHVLDERGAGVRGAEVAAIEYSPREATTYVTTTDASGRYAIDLDPRYPYVGMVAAPPRMRSTLVFDPRVATHDFTLEPAPITRPPDAEIRAYLDAHAMPIATHDPEARASDDLAPIAAAIGDARFVTIGEVTHGSREIFRLRHRLFQYLVEHAGVTVLGVELGFGSGLALDAYVQGGAGDPEALLRATVTDYVQTEEWRDLLAWMRAYNTAPKRTRKIHIDGFDVEGFTSVAAVTDAVKQLAPDRLDRITAALRPLSSYDADGTYAETPEPERAACTSAIGELRELFARSPDSAVLLHHLDVLDQASRIYVNPLVRDAVMADNVAWLGERRPGERVVLSMHDFHASKHGLFDDQLGHLLSKRLGRDSYVIGTAFGGGGFRSLGEDMSVGVQQFTLDAPLPGGLDDAMMLGASDLFALDLARADGPVGDWLDTPTTMWCFGFRFVGADGAAAKLIPRRTFDMLVFAKRVEAARALSKR